ncbi:MAG: hypothetical protein MZV64_23610 [Ignavibacteriales bacterium]|nr:hypothetical protein [Ignavibacteriales bacterium]
MSRPVTGAARRFHRRARPVAAAGWNARMSTRRCRSPRAWTAARRSAWQARADRAYSAVRMEVCSSCWTSSRIKFFKRRENDILLNLDINVAQAVLGAEIEVPTLDGDEKAEHPRRDTAWQGLSR